MLGQDEAMMLRECAGDVQGLNLGTGENELD